MSLSSLAAVHSKHHMRAFYPPPTTTMGAPWAIEIFDAGAEPERFERHRWAADWCCLRRNAPAVANARHTMGKDFPILVIEATLDGAPIGGGQMYMTDRHGALPIQRELEPYVDCAALQDLIWALAPERIVNLVGLWIEECYGATELSGDLGRAYVALVAMARARYYIGICPDDILDACRSIGFEPLASFGVLSYPDPRSKTRVILGDAKRWPDDLAAWAHRQAERAHRHSRSTRFALEPMRRAVHAA